MIIITAHSHNMYNNTCSALKLVAHFYATRLHTCGYWSYVHSIGGRKNLHHTILLTLANSNPYMWSMVCSKFLLASTSLGWYTIPRGLFLLRLRIDGTWTFPPTWIRLWESQLFWRELYIVRAVVKAGFKHQHHMLHCIYVCVVKPCCGKFWRCFYCVCVCALSEVVPLFCVVSVLWNSWHTRFNAFCSLTSCSRPA